MLPEMRARIPKEEKERALFRHAARNYGVFHRKEALTVRLLQLCNLASG
jgi:uncharacterized protein YigA (DUF484 family)